MTSIFWVHMSDITNLYLPMFFTDHAAWWPGALEAFFRQWTQQSPVVSLVASEGSCIQCYLYAPSTQHPAPSTQHRAWVYQQLCFSTSVPNMLLSGKREDSYSTSGKIGRKSGRLSLVAFYVYSHIRMKIMPTICVLFTTRGS